MAILLKNTSDGDLTLPALYLNTVIPPGGEVIIADTIANIVNSVGTIANFMQLATVPNGQTGAISPTPLGIAAGTVTAAMLASGAASSNIGALTGVLGGTIAAPTANSPSIVAAGTSGTPEQLTAAQSGSTILDNGSAVAYEKLPAYVASPSNIGLKLKFLVTADGFRVLPAAADTLTVGASTTTASTGHVDNTTVGECFEVQLVAANKWFATEVYGTHWAVT